MPGRPPREWFQRCTESVAAHGDAVDSAAVCGAVGARKSEPEQRAVARLENPMAAKRKTKKKHPSKRAPTKKGAHRKSSAKTPKRTESARRKTQRTPARGARVKHETRCANCGHAAVHVPGRGCLHFEGKRFCSCKQRG
jgi:hypothetical protein